MKKHINEIIIGLVLGVILSGLAYVTAWADYNIRQENKPTIIIIENANTEQKTNN